jgi:DNA polymerase-3 subunit delta
MYKNEFDNLIRSQKISNSFIFFGESLFLIDMYTKMMSNFDDANILNMYHDEYEFSSAKAHLSQGSLFGDRNILIIKSEKKVPKKELDILFGFADKNTDNIFIYAYYGSDHKTYNNKKTFSKNNVISVRFFHPKDYEAQNILLQIAQEKNVKIDKYTLSHLLQIHNGDISLSANEIDKFKVYDTEITTKDVDALVSGLNAINIEEFTKQLLLKKDFKTNLHSMLDHGEDEIKILTSIISFLTQLYMFNIYIRVNGAPNAIDILGYPAPPAIVQEKAQMCIKIKPNIYLKLHELLLESELKMKSANADKNAILLSTLLRVQSLL